MTNVPDRRRQYNNPFAHLADPSMRLMTSKQAERDSEWLREKRERDRDNSAAAAPAFSITLDAAALGALVKALANPAPAPVVDNGPTGNGYGPPQPTPIKCTAEQIIAAAEKARNFGGEPLAEPSGFAAAMMNAAKKARGEA